MRRREKKEGNGGGRVGRRSREGEGEEERREELEHLEKEPLSWAPRCETSTVSSIARLPHIDSLGGRSA